MRKEALDIALKPMEQVHMRLDPQRRFGCLHQTDAVIVSGLSWKRLPFQYVDITHLSQSGPGMYAATLKIFTGISVNGLKA
jgi:hypothetical protein